MLSVVVPVWDGLPLIKACVASLRATTDVPFEIVLVDNGSRPRCAQFLRDAADVLVRHERNLGYARGINAGLGVARGKAIALVNSDTVMPDGWASTMLEALDARHVGAVVPALTNAAVSRTVRTSPRNAVSRLLPFEQPPSGAVVLLKTDLLRRMGGLAERYGPAGAEDLDMAFTLWTNDLDLVFDERVLVSHVSKGTAGVKLASWPDRWREAGEAFLDHWTDPSAEVTDLGTCDPDRFARNRRVAAGAAGWMRAHADARRSSRPPLVDAARRATAANRAVGARLRGMGRR